MLAAVSWLRTVAHMEGNTQTAAARLHRYKQDHPGASIGYSPVKDLWRAWIPDAPGSTSGTELRPCRHLEDLLDRLDELADA